MYRPVRLLIVPALALSGSAGSEAIAGEVVDASTLRGKVVCGYRGWFRCPGDAADLGWVHWSRNRKHYPDGYEELYDLQDDPRERQNRFELRDGNIGRPGQNLGNSQGIA